MKRSKIVNLGVLITIFLLMLPGAPAVADQGLEGYSMSGQYTDKYFWKKKRYQRNRRDKRKIRAIRAVPRTPTPAGYDKSLTFIADGVYSSPDGTILVDGLAGDGVDFHMNIMGRSSAELQDRRNEALQFFEERFGLTNDDPDNLLFSGYEVSPLNQLTAYISTRERVARDGWHVFDGGHQYVVLNPEGMVLGGDFEGVHVPQFATFVYGEYKVMRERIKRNRRGRARVVSDPFVIQYQSTVPLQFTAAGALVRCELFSEEFGEGFNGGVMMNFIQQDGLMHADIRSVLTFPPLAESLNH